MVPPFFCPDRWGGGVYSQTYRVQAVRMYEAGESTRTPTRYVTWSEFSFIHASKFFRC